MIRLFRVFVPARVVALFVFDALLIASAFIAACYLALDFDIADYLLFDSGLIAILLVTLCILLGLYLHDLYSHIRVKSRVMLLQQLCLVMGVAFLLEGFISYLNPDLRVPIRVMLLGSCLAVPAIFAWRSLFGKFDTRIGPDRLLLVGGSPVLADIGRYVDDHPEAGLIVAGCVGDDRDAGPPLPGAKVLGRLSSLPEIIHATHPDRVVIGLRGPANSGFADELLDLRLAGSLVEGAARTYEKVTGRVSVNALQPFRLICSSEFEPPPQSFFYQRLSNAAAAFLGIVVSLPLMALTALAVKLSAPGPALDRHVRIGLDDQPFTRYSFRAGPGRAASFIRRLHLDQLPQLFNVLKGEMSLVGPRPERPEFVEALSRTIPCFRQRHRVRPGMTGWAQFRMGAGVEDAVARLEYDLYYIKNLSLSLDTFVIFQAIRSIVFSSEGR